jgi:hypothetical protein
MTDTCRGRIRLTPLARRATRYRQLGPFERDTVLELKSMTIESPTIALLAKKMSRLADENAELREESLDSAASAIDTLRQLSEN